MTDPLEEPNLVYFGKTIVDRVRDQTIGEWDRVVAGTMPDAESRAVHERVVALGPDAVKLIGEIIPKIVDTTLHYMMFALEQGDFLGISVIVKNQEGGQSQPLHEISEGLSGDLLYWIDAYSKQRHDIGLVGDPVDRGSPVGMPPSSAASE